MAKKAKALTSDAALKPFAEELGQLSWFFQCSFIGPGSNYLSSDANSEPIISLIATRKHRKILHALARMPEHQVRILAASVDYYPWHLRHMQLSIALGPMCGLAFLLCPAPNPDGYYTSMIIRSQKAELDNLIGLCRQQLRAALEVFQRYYQETKDHLELYTTLKPREQTI